MVDKLGSILIFIGNWCGDNVQCKQEMITCAKKHVIEWSEEKILLSCWKDPKK